MSIDKLISLLDRDPRAFSKIRSCSIEIIEDYIGVADAYIDLLISVKDNRDKVYYISKIVQELMINVEGLNALVRVIDLNQVDDPQIESLAGQVLRGEHNIDSLIEKFEAIDQS